MENIGQIFVNINNGDYAKEISLAREKELELDYKRFIAEKIQPTICMKILYSLGILENIRLGNINNDLKLLEERINSLQKKWEKDFLEKNKNVSFWGIFKDWKKIDEMIVYLESETAESVDFINHRGFPNLLAIEYERSIYFKEEWVLLAKKYSIEKLENLRDNLSVSIVF